MEQIETDNLIERLDKWLRENRPDYYLHLKPRATIEEVTKLENTLGLQLPIELKKFLYWKNGQDDDSKFLENWTLLSCEDILAFWQSLTEWQENGTFDVENWWNRNWIPFLYDDTGNNVCIDMAGMFGGKPGQILYYWHDDNSREIIHESFYKWLETVVLAMEKDLMYYCQPNADYDDYLEFLELNNPGYPIEVYVDEE